MSGEHTPGPWEAKPRHGGGAWRIRTVGEQLEIADVWEADDEISFPMEANARLIAAAPELYDGCNALLGLLQLLAGRDDINAEVRTCLTVGHRIADAEMAVRKAQGDAR